MKVVKSYPTDDNSASKEDDGGETGDDEVPGYGRLTRAPCKLGVMRVLIVITRQGGSPQSSMMEQLTWMTPGLRESAKSLSAWREPRMIMAREKKTVRNIKRIISQVVLLA